MPFGENSTVTLDSETGIISGTASITGIYSYSICLEEYRDGILLGKSNREVSSMSFLQMTSSNDNIATEAINVYPNPVRNIFHIETEIDVSSIDILSFREELIQKNISLIDNSYDVSYLDSGVYFLRVYDRAGHVHVHKFAKI